MRRLHALALVGKEPCGISTEHRKAMFSHPVTVKSMSFSHVLQQLSIARNLQKTGRSGFLRAFACMSDDNIKQIYTLINYFCRYLSWGCELNKT